MTTPSVDRLDDLLADAALDALDASDREWLDALHGTERDDALELERVAALIAISADATPIPATLSAALEADAASWRRSTWWARTRQRVVTRRWTGAAAMAAAILVALTAWWMAQVSGAGIDHRTPAQQRAWILAHDDAQQQSWSPGPVRGSATWSAQANVGMLTLANAPLNDQSSWCYGVYLHDGQNWHPFSRFDVDEAGCTRFVPIEPTEPFPVIARVVIAEVAPTGAMPMAPTDLRAVVSCDFPPVN